MEPSLGLFFADMALDPLRFADFLQDPEATMRAANLSEEDRTAILGRQEQTIHARLSLERGAPMSAPWNCPGMVQMFF